MVVSNDHCSTQFGSNNFRYQGSETIGQFNDHLKKKPGFDLRYNVNIKLSVQIKVKQINKLKRVRLS